ncbi:DUF2125 domain-containing protein [uncultured Roseobacter sp.]|uniref:DUF2125 domain-containing protein n=1 Tax=uncultured Roseobacter sp. TaxID=114847 RepID=UPI002614E043|nr:DUF2125 domain-containing protein [uncultured Roseobacter sp.]
MIFSRLTPATLGVALAMAPAAQADITAQDVWRDWQAYFVGLGQTLEATEVDEGDALVLTDLTFSSTNPGNDGETVIRLGQITFQETDDGSVDILVPEVMSATIETLLPEAEPVVMRFDLRLQDMAANVTGVPTEMVTTYSAREITAELADPTIEGDAEPMDIDGLFTLTDLSGTTETTVGGTRSYVQDLDAGAMLYNLEIDDPDSDGRMSIAGTLNTLASDSRSTVPLAVVGAEGMADLLDAGMNVDGSFTYQDGSTAFSLVDGNDGTQQMSAQTSTEGGTLGVSMAEDGLTYDIAGQGLAAVLSLPDFPVPITLDMEEARFNLTMPVRQSETAEEVALGLTLDAFTLSDALWALFDPQGTLPRDPGTIALDLTGTARLLLDILDPTAAEAMAVPGATVAEIETLDINTLEIALAGAALTGTGAFTFDNSDPTAPARPSGAADLMLKGGNALLDGLVAIGLLPEDNAIGARMMMGMLAVPGDAPDTLNSRIEVTEEGHIIANGQRIR